MDLCYHPLLKDPVLAAADASFPNSATTPGPGVFDDQALRALLRPLLQGPSNKARQSMGATTKPKRTLKLERNTACTVAQLEFVIYTPQCRLSALPEWSESYSLFRYQIYII